MASDRETGVHVMADLADVESALVDLATSVLYPNGTDVPSALGVDCRVYRGWPAPAGLDADLRAGKVNVSVFPDSTPGQTVTCHGSAWQGTPNMPTLTATVVAETVTFGGTAEPGQIAGILFNRRSFVYRTVAGDTPALVAANLVTSIRLQQIAQSRGTSIIIPGASNIIARVVADSPVLREIRRQSHDLRVTLWCPNPGLRDLAASLIDVALADRVFISFPDTSVGHIQYKNTVIYDQSQNASLYRRDLIYSVEYPTIISASLPSMIFGDLSLDASTQDVS